MKKILTCLLALNILLLVGCGKIYTSNDNINNSGTVIEEKDTQVDQCEGSTALWEQDVQVDECEMFQESDLIQFDDHSVTWENNKGRAQLKSVDNKETYLTYKSELGECSNVEFDFIKDNRITGTKFYEADIGSDGDKELLISYTQVTGSGRNGCAISIFDLNNNNFIPLFTDNDFSKEQKQDIFDTISTWNSQGFKEKSEVVINDISDIKSSIFDPTLVKVNGKYMIKVEYVLPAPVFFLENYKGFYALLEFRGDLLVVNDLWCEL